tara:strand:+ start:151 stop:753 length:603 start_codon:yes stop_codon:yes gene_type:complete
MNYNNLNITPMMDPQEINLIKKYLKPNDVMLEYGSGGSTLLFSQFVSEYYSIEHNHEWAVEVQNQIKDNVTYNVIDPKSGEVNDIFAGPPTLFKYKKGNIVQYDNIPHSWDKLKNSPYYNELEKYITHPHTYNKIFDVVLVDGRARPECAQFIYDYIHNDSILFIHDYFPRERYSCVLEKYDMVDSIQTTSQTIAVFKKK